MDIREFETFISDLTEREAGAYTNNNNIMDPTWLALKLTSFLDIYKSHDIIFREKFVVLIDKLLNDDDLYTWRNRVSVSIQSTIKCILLDIMKLEESELVMFKLRKIVWKLAASLLPDNNWPELLPFLYQCVSCSSTSDDDSNNYLKLSALLILARLAGNIGETLVGWVKSLHSVFRNTLNDDTLNDLDVRLGAMCTVIRFIVNVLTLNEKERFQDLLPGMMKTLTDALLMSNGSKEEGVAANALTFLIELAKKDPRFFRQQLVIVVGTMIDIAEDESLENATRQLAVEFLITLVEAKEKTPGMMKRLPLFISRCFAVLLKLLLDVKDDPAWHSAETVDDDTGATSNFHVGEEYLDRFSLALGGKSIAYIAKEQLSAYLVAPEWVKRHAALFALAFIAEGCIEVIIKNLDQVVNIVLNCFQDPHPRVRWAACRAICQLFVEISPRVQEQYHTQVILALSAAMDDFHPRVQACGTRVLGCLYFCRPDQSETLVPHLDEIVKKLVILLQNDKQMLQQEALETLASLAESVQEHFQTFYDTVMPQLKNVLRNAELKSNHVLRDRAMECIRVVGMAVGKEEFRDDKQVTEVLMLLQGLQVKANDLNASLALRACARICKYMGPEFLPYMSTVMPFLIKCAQLDPVMAISTELEYENCDLDDNIRDKILEEKADACHMLSWYANTLKEHFYPWIPQAVSVLVPLLKFYTYTDVRISSVQAMPVLLCSAKLAVEKGIAQGSSESYFKVLSDYIIKALLEALHEEHVTEISALMLDVLNNCLQICQPLLHESQLHLIVDELKHVFTESSNRKGKLRERAKTEDFDDEEAELLKGEKMQDDLILSHVGEILVTLIKTFKADFLPFFDELSSYLISMWGKDMTAQARCTSSSTFSYLLEECPEAALKYCDVFLPLFLDASNDENPEVRQNALYGLGLYAESGSSVFKSFVQEAISRINVVIMHVRACEPENENAYGHAVFALGKICQFHPESIELAQIIPIWLSCLPIKGDLDEAEYVYGELCWMVERLDREIIGHNYQYLPKIISVFAEVLYCKEALPTEETANRMINILRHLHQTLPPTAFQSTWSNLLPGQEMELKSILSLEEDAYF